MDWSIPILVLFLVFDIVAMLLFHKAPIIGFFFGFFGAMAGMYFAWGTLFDAGLVGWFGIFETVISILTMLVCAFGYDVLGSSRGRR